MSAHGNGAATRLRFHRIPGPTVTGVLFLLLLFSGSPTAPDAAMLYTCTDRAGNVSITDSPTPDAQCESRGRGAESLPQEAQRAGIETIPYPSEDGIVPKAEVTENLAYTYYTAEADSRKSLLSILNASSPIRHQGRVYHGWYDSHVSWSCGAVSQGRQNIQDYQGHCHIDRHDHVTPAEGGDLVTTRQVRCVSFSATSPRAGSP